MSGLEDRFLTLIKDLEEEKRLADKRAKQLYLAAGGGSFIDHDDTPAAYAGGAGKFVKVNAVPDGLEFTDHTKAVHDALAIDHGSLGGKADDDHGQYYNVARHTKAVHDALLIDAATVGTLAASAFIRSNADDNVAGHTEWQDGYTIRLGAGADFRMWHDGTNHYFRSYKHGVNMIWQGENAAGTNRTLMTLDPDNRRAQFYQISTSDVLYADNKIDSLFTYNYTTTSFANVYIFGTGVFARSTSSEKHKKNITNLEVDPSLIHKLRPVSFQSKCEIDDKNIRRVGLIAEEVDEHIPGIVIKSEVFERAKTGEDLSKNINTGRVAVEGIDYNSLTVLMLKEIQNHEAEIKALKARLNN